MSEVLLSDDAPAFTVERVSIGLGNRTYSNERAFAEAFLRVGPFRVTAYLLADGTVQLPSSLRDETLQLAIAEAVRAEALEEVTGRWGAVTRCEKARLQKRSKGTQGSYAHP